jgi:hypothetical protein
VTLLEVARQLETLPRDHSIYGNRIECQWSGASPAVVTKVQGPVTVTGEGIIQTEFAGRTWEYVLDVVEAQKTVEVLKQWSENPEPDAEEKLKAILYYAEHRSYLPVGNYYNEEHAEPFDLGVEWDTGAPVPVLISSEYRAFLVFYLKDADVSHGSPVSGNDPVVERSDLIAVVEFERCHSAMLGAPNEEVLHGHRLWGRGLKHYGAFIVRNSAWVAELERINAAHSNHREETWHRANHYILCFHDSTFECVAESFNLRTFIAYMGDVLRMVLQDL